MEKYDLEKDREFFDKTEETLMSLCRLSQEDFEINSSINYFMQLYHQGKICSLEKTAEHKPFEITGNESIIKNSPLPYKVLNSHSIIIDDWKDGISIFIEPIVGNDKKNLFEDSAVGINFCVNSGWGEDNRYHFSIWHILAQNALEFIDFFLLNVAKVDEEFKKQDAQSNKLAELRKKQIKLILYNRINPNCLCDLDYFYDSVHFPKLSEWLSQVDKTSMEFRIYQKACNNDFGLKIFGNEPQIEGRLYVRVNDDIRLEHYIYAENPEKFEEKLLEIKKRVDDIKALVGDTSEKSEKAAA